MLNECEYLYHITFKEYLDSIIDKGLIPSFHKNFRCSKNGIYISDEISTCEYMMATYELEGIGKKDTDDVVMLRVRKNDLDINYIERDEPLKGTYDYEHSFIYKRPIETNLIELIDYDRWRNAKTFLYDYDITSVQRLIDIKNNCS